MFVLNEEATGWTATILIALATVWKLFFRGRKDLREDGAGVDYQDAYRSLVKDFQSEIDRLNDVVVALGNRLDEESLKRRETEHENYNLKLRIMHLESEVRRLGGTL